MGHNILLQDDLNSPEFWDGKLKIIPEYKLNLK